MAQPTREQLKIIAEKAVLVGVGLPGEYVDAADPFSELRALAKTAGSDVVGELFQNRQHPDGRTFLGKGKVEELKALIQMLGATLVIFDNELSPSQIGNLEEDLSIKIVDRSELILDIFANRAATTEAKLQVEIAQLEYTYPRLRAMWDHLGKVVGGAPIGIGTRGPGEQQLEIDRRLVQKRLQKLKDDLEHVQERKSREVAHRNQSHFTVGLVGYTNAGKSTLFNRLTSGGAFAHPKLFATLSTRIEKWDLGGGNAVMLSDTVGFIRKLPHHLVASFRSTLEDAILSKLIIIVLDISDPHATMQLETVRATLEEIGATAQPRILVFNKIDQLKEANALTLWLHRHPEALPVSATSGDGLDDLRAAVLGHFLGGVKQVQIALPMGDTKKIMYLEKRTKVLDRQYDDRNALFTVKIGRRQMEELVSQGGTELLVDGERPHEAIDRLWGNGRFGAEPRVPLHEKHVGDE